MNVGVVGLGNMGGAIARGLIRSGMDASSVLGFDVDASAAARLCCTAATVAQVARLIPAAVVVRVTLVAAAVAEIRTSPTLEESVETA